MEQLEFLCEGRGGIATYRCFKAEARRKSKARARAKAESEPERKAKSNPAPLKDKGLRHPITLLRSDPSRPEEFSSPPVVYLFFPARSHVRMAAVVTCE